MEQHGNTLPPNPVNVRQTLTYLRLEPYEGKLSCTVLRQERRGNPPDPADSLNPDRFEPVRLEFHAGKLFTGQDIRGKEKNFDDLKQANQIAILAKERFFGDDILLHAF
jgi:hypothetical protein